MTGAARLAAQGARRIGAGLVTIAAPPDVFAIYAAGAPGTLVAQVPDAPSFTVLLSDDRKNAVLIGPGAGVSRHTKLLVEAAIKTDKAIVLDADALTVFADSPGELFALTSSSLSCVLTPHEGEFKRLFTMTGDKLTRAREAASQCGAVVLLKGADTVIAAPDGRTAINVGAPPELATAGSGDVLAGFIVGLLAQGMNAFDAACAGAWLHGRAATLFGPGLIAEDLADNLPPILRDLLKMKSGQA